MTSHGRRSIHIVRLQKLNHVRTAGVFLILQSKHIYEKPHKTSSYTDYIKNLVECSFLKAYVLCWNLFFVLICGRIMIGLFQKWWAKFTFRDLWINTPRRVHIDHYSPYLALSITPLGWLRSNDIILSDSSEFPPRVSLWFEISLDRT